MPQINRQWRTLEELASDPAIIARGVQEFPGLAEAISTPQDRRKAIKLMAAALALGGGSGCDAGAPWGHLIPAVRAPPDVIPGLPNFYSTANVHSGYATGVVVKNWMGRPIKVEGNPSHPASLGATDVFAQAQLLDFYNPDRAWEMVRGGLPSDRPNLENALAQQREEIAITNGKGFVIVTGATTSPTLSAQLEALRGAYPEVRWLHWEPISRANAAQGATLAYGHPVEATLRLAEADVILAIDSDLLSAAPGHLRFAHDFATRRNPARAAKMSRIYAIEPTPTLTGSVADHRFIAGLRDLRQIVLTLASAILNDAVAEGPSWLPEVVADLKAHQGRALIHAGPHQPPETHALVHAMNEALGGRRNTFDLIAPVTHASTDVSLAELVEDMRVGRVRSLVIIDSNPVFAAPEPLGFVEALRQVEFSLTLTPTQNETSAVTLWAVPMTHPWESWSDARAYDGAASIMQPQALPLYGGVDPHHLLALLLQPDPPETYDLVRATWKPLMGTDFEESWREALADGVVSNSAASHVDVKLQAGAARLAPPLPDGSLTILFRPDPYIWDGRYADNAWLQELPRPLTKLTWDNPLLISPQLAQRMALRNGDRVRLSAGTASLSTPVWVAPGQADDCVVALLGFGRPHAGPVGRDVGVDFFRLMNHTQAPALEKIDGHVELASTEHHNLIFDKSNRYARSGTLAEFNKDEHFLAPEQESGPFLYRWRPEGPAAWGMSIDLNACIGCGACVVACQAENNIPSVGKAQVLREREMYWLRIDRYYEGSAREPKINFQPTLCMHCEQAPCEPVCPVGATMHDSEGLNVMVYNRCIGTRFCSNNCPYKVRRFNYFAFAEEERRPIESRNPDVTVRARGVMEKCTFCIQRIAEARIAADRDSRPVGEVVTACQAACPTRAFTFGNLAAPDSDVVKHKASPLTYALLADQNTVPRVTYEARIVNVNPSIAEARK